MRSILLILSIFCYSALQAQQSVPVSDSGEISVRNFSPGKIIAYKEGSEFRYEEKIEPPNSLLGRFWNWLAKIFDNIFNYPYTGKTIKALFILMASCVLIFFVYILSGMNKGSFWSKNNAGSGLAYTVSDEDIHSINFREAIEQAINSGNYRLATRLLYLQSLKQLADRGLINWQIDKTNTAYIGELTDPSQREQFYRLTLQFESNWYGNVPIGPEAFAGVQQQFGQFNQQLA